MAGVMGFRTWLRQQKGRSDVVGALARDAFAGNDLYCFDGCHFDGYVGLKRHLQTRHRSAPSGVYDALDIAAAEYRDATAVRV